MDSLLVSASVAGGASRVAQIGIKIAKLTFDYDEALRAAQDFQPNSFIVISFRGTQAQRIEALQHAVDAITATENEEHRQMRLNKAIDEKLHVYASAIRDYETLSQEAVPDFLPTPGILSTMKATWEGKVNEWRLENSHRRRLREEIPLDMRKYMFRELNREIRLDREKERALFSRLGMGLFGGVALIFPMTVMVFLPGRNTSVATTSVATLLFAVVLAAKGRGLDGKDILAATAAYAAVMVVFVGASSDG